MCKVFSWICFKVWDSRFTARSTAPNVPRSFLVYWADFNGVQIDFTCINSWSVNISIRIYVSAAVVAGYWHRSVLYILSPPSTIQAAPLVSTVTLRVLPVSVVVACAFYIIFLTF
jgi:hypothetical protein